MSAETAPWPPDGSGDDGVAAVRDALSAMGSGGSGAGGAGLREQLRAWDRVRRIVEAHVVDLVVEAERTEAFRDDGHVSVTNWVMAETNCPRAEAMHIARTASLVSASPGVGDELRSARIGVGQVRELARANANPRIDRIDDDVIARLLGEARQLPFHGFQALVRQWEALVDADGAHDDHERAHAGRRASLTLSGATGYLQGQFGAAQTAELMEIFDRFVNAEFLAEWEDLRARFGDDATPTMLERTEAQRRADAIVALFRRAAATDPAAQEPEILVNILLPADVFEEQLRAMLEQRPPNFDATSLRMRLCTTTNGVPIDPADAVIAALIGQVRRVVVNSKGVIIDLGRKSRLFTGSARDAALLQGLLDSLGRCIWPGCGRKRCQLDHSDEWRDGGLTDLINAALLCGRHNRFKSRGYRTWRDDHGVWHVVRPDGTELAPAA